MAAKTSTPKTAQVPATRKSPVRQAITFELVQAHAPHAGLAENLSRTFGINPVDYAAILEATEENIALSAKALQPTLNDKAMEIHLQRVVGSFVSSAYGLEPRQPNRPKRIGRRARTQRTNRGFGVIRPLERLS